MRTVHIGIGHNDNLIVAKLADIKVVAVSLRKTASKALIMVLISALARTLSMLAFLHSKSCLE